MDRHYRTHGEIWVSIWATYHWEKICTATKNQGSQPWMIQSNYLMCHMNSHLSHQQELDWDILKPRTYASATLLKMLLPRVSKAPEEFFFFFLQWIRLQKKNMINMLPRISRCAYFSTSSTIVGKYKIRTKHTPHYLCIQTSYFVYTKKANHVLITGKEFCQFLVLIWKKNLFRSLKIQGLWPSNTNKKMKSNLG